MARQVAQGGNVDRLVEVNDKLAEEATRAGEVVHRLRRFFRDRSSEMQAADLAALIRDIVQSQARRAEGLGVRLACSCDPLPAVWLDPVQIGVVLRNLLANAIDAASADADPGRSVSLRCTAGGQEVTVTVLDTGPGLEPDDATRVFESRRSDKPGGMGVGLAISRSIVEAHGGRLWADPGPGGKFHFTLPAEPVPA
jgi:signal transduction histidine kinase